MVPCIELCYDISNHVSSDRSQAITTCHQIITFHQARSSPSDPCLHKLQQACQSDSVDPLPSFSLPLRCSHGCRCNQVYSSCSQLPLACPYPTFCLRPLRSYREAEVGEAADQVVDVANVNFGFSSTASTLEPPRRSERRASATFAVAALQKAEVGSNTDTSATTVGTSGRAIASRWKRVHNRH